MCLIPQKQAWCLRFVPREGITLIEVVAALGLMGTLLALTLLSGSKHLAQMKSAETKRTSVRMLDNFLAKWSISNFSESSVQEAVAYSGLSAIGQFGSHEYIQNKNSQKTTFQVDIQRIRDAGFGEGAIFRLSVTQPNSSGERRLIAWAEVIAPR